jgi:beta-lactamase superfamily II metal-dependent hydrolase
VTRKVILAFLFVLLVSSLVFGQANGKLEIHFMDIGQGDGTILISPEGETVLFDNGVEKQCDAPVSYLQQLGVTKINYHVASHYHADHIGCTEEVLKAFPLISDAFDRGFSYQGQVFRRYLQAITDKRKDGVPGEQIVLDASGSDPVIIRFVAVNGDGISTRNENDLSLVAVIKFGKFDAVMGGDLSGFNTLQYKDIESSVAQKVGQVEVYKVHHHGSNHSSNPKWLETIKPKVGIISVGQNTYGHPTAQTLKRLHDAGIKTYWTEKGNGESPDQEHDVVGGNIRVEVKPKAEEFNVISSWNRVDTYPVWEAETPKEVSRLVYAWSKKSGVYHRANCKYVSNIDPENLERGDTPPEGKELHKGCPSR